MGYTGAVYKQFFGNASGNLYAVLILLVWLILPLWAAVRIFKRKDL